MYRVIRVTPNGYSRVIQITRENLLETISPRDLKIIDENQNFRISALVPGNGYLLCKLDYLRAIIKNDSVLIFTSQNSNTQTTIDRFLNTLNILLRQQDFQGINTATPELQTARRPPSDRHQGATSGTVPVRQPIGIAPPPILAIDPLSSRLLQSPEVSCRKGVASPIEVGSQNHLSTVQAEAKCDTVSVESSSTEQYFSLFVFEQILKHVDEFYDSLVEQLRPEIVSLDRLLSNHQIKEITEKQLINLQTQHLNSQYRIKDTAELLQDIDGWEEDEKAEFNLTGNPQMTAKVDDLINSYAKYFEESSDEIEKMGKRLDFALRIMDIKGLALRNKIAERNLTLSLLTVSTGLGMFVFSAFGMNLKSQLESSTIAFYTTTVTVILVTLIFFLVGRSLFLGNLV